MHADQKLYLVFEFLDMDLKRYIDVGNQHGTPITLDVVKVSIPCTIIRLVSPFSCSLRRVSGAVDQLGVSSFRPCAFRNFFRTESDLHTGGERLARLIRFPPFCNVSYSISHHSSYTGPEPRFSVCAIFYYGSPIYVERDPRTLHVTATTHFATKSIHSSPNTETDPRQLPTHRNSLIN